MPPPFLFVVGIGLLALDPEDLVELWFAVFASEGSGEGVSAHTVVIDSIDPEQVFGDVIKGRDDHDASSPEFHGH